MATRYNGLLDSERLAVVALRTRMELLALREADVTKVPTPEYVLGEIITEAKLSNKDHNQPMGRPTRRTRGTG